MNPHDDQQWGASDCGGTLARGVPSPQEIHSGRPRPGVVGYYGICIPVFDGTEKVLIRQHICACVTHCMTERGALATCADLMVSEFLDDWQWSVVGVC